MSNLDAIELGCGTAYVSAWMARRGARVVSIDDSEKQLATAHRLQRQYGLNFPLIHGNAESVAYPDSSFDFAISEYGACLWADPIRWVPEAARLLRPGAQLVFLTNSFLAALCMPPEDDAVVTDRLLRSVSAMHRIEWPGNQGVEFHLSHGEWIKLFKRTGFEIEDLIELMPGPKRSERAIQSARNGHKNGRARKFGSCANAVEISRTGAAKLSRSLNLTQTERRLK
jgi:SAM-dependent methyltransferase